MAQLAAALRVNTSDVYTDVNYTYVYDENGTYYMGGGVPAEDATMTILYHYVDPVIIAIGLVGNILTCYAMRQTPFSNFSVAVYLFACALSNVMNLLLHSTVIWFTDILSDTPIYEGSDFRCRIWQFVVRLVNFSASWFIVGAIIDRYIVLWHPHKAQDMCTVFTARIAVAFTIIGLTVVSVHAMWMYDVSPEGKCFPPHSDPQLGWLWVSGVLLAILPMILIFIIGNSLIVRYCLKHCGSRIPDTERANTELTHSVVVLSMVYFFFTFPATVINIIDMVKPLSWRTDAFINMALNKARNGTNYLSSLNHLCLFTILLAFSKVFRKTIKSGIWNCVTCIRRRSVSVELRIMTDNYEQVPSNSTSM